MGAILFSLGALVLLTTLETKDVVGYFISGFFIGLGLMFLGCARLVEQVEIRYKKYIKYVVTDKQTSIYNLATASKVSYNTAARRLQLMINNGYLGEYYIDERSHAILLRGTLVENVASSLQNKVETAHKVVACPGCGAKNTIVIGQPSQCEYCGSPL